MNNYFILTDEIGAELICDKHGNIKKFPTRSSAQQHAKKLKLYDKLKICKINT
jgi:hypothetical protein